ncbi:D-2-hydroxyacid dehydrogenase [Pseudarthrobacter sp. NBSH8]|uniref:D-2-hydroxyacid dehydrogenase n=1 Tax=Pseudarthrobacter sp. NBSH8 TaxID=2596911 RepID=UPI0016262D71|nr:D-2-hydroxyacid dehydrogenase [Pseudarthrobacter sp. NBSH8]QNE16341.1 D-2-hydroxyacid dehydrogenase [Pseudarthrobacter sp. NBSH8]
MPRVVVLVAEGQPRPYNLAALDALAHVVLTDSAGLAEASRRADILFLWDFFSSALREAWPHADSLKWVHVAAAGVDAMMFEELRSSEVVVTNAHGTFDRPIAEFVLASILAHDKQLHRSKALQQQGIWEHREVTRTEGSRALVVGTGGIGRATARLLRAVGLEVRGVGRTARDDDPDFGAILASEDLAAHAGWADHVVLIAPLTDQTRNMLDREVLAAMKPSAHLINVGRGALVDEPALIEALRSGQIAAASLDVFTEEPVPASHPFWSMDNVHMSAHMCGDVIGWRDALARQFQANLERWTAGEQLNNVVDKQRGYVSRH